MYSADDKRDGRVSLSPHALIGQLSIGACSRIGDIGHAALHRASVITGERAGHHGKLVLSVATWPGLPSLISDSVADLRFLNKIIRERDKA